MICPRCKLYLPNDGKFCPHCGGVIQKERKDLEKETADDTNFIIEDAPYVIPVKVVSDRKALLTIFVIGILIAAVVSGYQYIFYPVNNLVSEMKTHSSWEDVMDSYDNEIRNLSIRRTVLEKKLILPVRTLLNFVNPEKRMKRQKSILQKQNILVRFSNMQE